MGGGRLIDAALFLAGYAAGALVGLAACLRWGNRRRNREMWNIDWKARYELLEAETKGYGENTLSPLCEVLSAKNSTIKGLRDEIAALQEQVKALKEELRSRGHGE